VKPIICLIIVAAFHDRRAPFGVSRIFSPKLSRNHMQSSKSQVVEAVLRKRKEAKNHYLQKPTYLRSKLAEAARNTRRKIGHGWKLRFTHHSLISGLLAGHWECRIALIRFKLQSDLFDRSILTLIMTSSGRHLAAR
jgi:hypothetical protein